jgi:NAD(P)-dependent dehydrogenase (short-subunit alcohol dehydrogenase family)
MIKGLAPLVGVALLAGAAAILRRRSMLDMRGRVVLVTGSSRGLGLALAEEFASHGARLVLCGRTPETLERARKRVAALGVDVLAIRCDVSRRDQVEAMIARVNEHFGPVDVLVNNAGVMTVGPLQTQTFEDFDEAIRVMFWGAFYPTFTVLPSMRQRRTGRIVNITSIGGRIAVPHLLPYTTAKFALVGFSEGLRAELAGDGIGVTTVVPGLMRTGSHINARTKGRHEFEYALFGLLASLPFTSMDARSAARQIVAAARHGDAEIILTVQAQLASRLNGLLPGIFPDVFGLVARFLPSGGERAQERVLGRDSETRLTRSFLTELGRRAAAEFNQN